MYLPSFCLILGQNAGVPFDVLIRVFDIWVINQMNYFVVHAFILSILKYVGESFSTPNPCFEEILDQIRRCEIPNENTFFKNMKGFFKKISAVESKAELNYLDECIIPDKPAKSAYK